MTRVLCDTNAVWSNFDTESAETRAKPNRPDGRLMSARATADSSKLGRCHSHRHQPSVSASPATRKFALRTKNTDELKRTKLRVFLPKGEFPCRLRDRKIRQSRASAISGSEAFRCLQCRSINLYSSVENHAETQRTQRREGKTMTLTSHGNLNLKGFIHHYGNCRTLSVVLVSSEISAFSASLREVIASNEYMNCRI